MVLPNRTALSTRLHCRGCQTGLPSYAGRGHATRGSPESPRSRVRIGNRELRHPGAEKCALPPLIRELSATCSFCRMTLRGLLAGGHPVRRLKRHQAPSTTLSDM